MEAVALQGSYMYDICTNDQKWHYLPSVIQSGNLGDGTIVEVHAETSYILISILHELCFNQDRKPIEKYLLPSHHLFWPPKFEPHVRAG